ncbi:hypothetical protein CF15_05210 [Pyrodictium occultum]|uniref:Uncharacterized protein n=1 Tax=Pyrodictium occultum TaxID=2309 RepID=A0A0V8RW10_PYROC|nr:hypothetical protein [Pyrodictium occultum]KSW12162.1 hypothetical protein CF15_05210 [Pyrodictium occultum]
MEDQYEACLGLGEALRVTARLLCRLARLSGLCDLAEGAEPPLEEAALLLEEAGVEPPEPLPRLASSCRGVASLLLLLEAAAQRAGLAPPTAT